MTQVKVQGAELGRSQSFLSYDSLAEINSIDPERQFKYAPERYYTPSAEFYNRSLFFGIGEASAQSICDELKQRGYIGLIEIENINSRQGINQIRGRPVILA